MMEATYYTPETVARATRLEPSKARVWECRDLLPLPAPPGPGLPRRYTLREALGVGLMRTLVEDVGLPPRRVRDALELVRSHLVYVERGAACWLLVRTVEGGHESLVLTATQDVARAVLPARAEAPDVVLLVDVRAAFERLRRALDEATGEGA